MLIISNTELSVRHTTVCCKLPMLLNFDRGYTSDLAYDVMGYIQLVHTAMTDFQITCGFVQSCTCEFYAT